MSGLGATGQLALRLDDFAKAQDAAVRAGRADAAAWQRPFALWNTSHALRDLALLFPAFPVKPAAIGSITDTEAWLRFEYHSWLPSGETCIMSGLPPIGQLSTTACESNSTTLMLPASRLLTYR